MKVYFYVEDTSREDDVKQIINYLRKIKVDFNSNVDKKTISNNLSELSLEKVDALIVYGKRLDAQSGYLIALALTQKKQVLCLLPDNVRLDNSLRSLQKNKSFSKQLQIKFYDKKNLTNQLADFLQSMDNSTISDVINIKYTLRLSSKLSDYLDWKAKQTGSRKADWLRDQISQMMNNDEDYKKFVDKKFDV